MNFLVAFFSIMCEFVVFSVTIIALGLNDEMDFWDDFGNEGEFLY